MEVLKFFTIGSNKHVAHEKSVIGTSADDSNLNLVILIPSCKAIDNVDPISRIKIINCPLTINSPDLLKRISVVDYLRIWGT